MGTLYLTDGDDLTSIANAIRAKSGGSSQLAFPADFVTAIGAISGGMGDSGSFSTSYQTYHWDTVTIGANSLTNTLDLWNYLCTAVGASTATDNNTRNRFWFSMEDAPTPYNNMIGSRASTLSGNTPQIRRYRSGSWSTTAIASDYDASVRSGTKYFCFWVTGQAS